MTAAELQIVETRFREHGYKKWTRCLIGGESWAWFKKISTVLDADGEMSEGIQMAFRVWDNRHVSGLSKDLAFSVMFWASPSNLNSRIDLEAAWAPIADIAAFERMAAEFNQLARKYTH